MNKTKIRTLRLKAEDRQMNSSQMLVSLRKLLDLKNTEIAIRYLEILGSNLLQSGTGPSILKQIFMEFKNRKIPIENVTIVTGQVPTDGDMNTMLNFAEYSKYPEETQLQFMGLKDNDQIPLERILTIVERSYLALEFILEPIEKRISVTALNNGVTMVTDIEINSYGMVVDVDEIKKKKDYIRIETIIEQLEKLT